MYGSTVFDQSTVSAKLSRAGTAILSQLSEMVRLELIRSMLSKMQFLYKRRDVLEAQRLLRKSCPRSSMSRWELLREAFRVCAS